MSTGPHILSIVEEILGHKTYGRLMRSYFDQVGACQLDLYWYNEERELHTRIINRLLSFYLRNQWAQKQNIDFRLFRFQLGFAYMARRLVLRKIKQADYAVLHLHTQPLAFLLPDLLQQIPTVITIDRTIAQASRDTTHPNFQWTYAPNIWLDQQAFRHAAQIVSFSEAARQSVIADFQIDPNKVQVIYPGVDLTQITMPDRSIPDRSMPDQSMPDRPKILFVGGDFERKGGHDLLQVFLDRFADQAELHLVTHEPIKCVHPHLHIHRDIEAYTPEWLSFYHQADLFVMPTYAEPFGWVFIEAMAAGLPIVATQLNAIPEMVEDGKTGFLIQPGDRTALAEKIQILLDQPQLRRAMGYQARQRAEQKFDAYHNFQALELVFQEAAAVGRSQKTSSVQTFSPFVPIASKTDFP